MNQLTQRDQFKSSRLLCTIVQLSDFLEWALCQSWQPLLFSRGLKTIAHSPKVRHFQTQEPLAQVEKNSGSRLPILKIKTNSILERPHLSFTARENMKAGENVQK